MDAQQSVFEMDLARVIPEEEKPLARLLTGGTESLKNSELLAVVGHIPLDLAERILIKYATLEAVARAPIADLAKIKGLGQTKAAAIHAAFLLGARLSQSKAAAHEVDTPAKIYQLLGEEMRLLNQEVVKVVLVNAKFCLIAVEEVFRGSLDSVLAHPREIFRAAISRQAYALVVVHNHPSGNPSPSLADHQITMQLKKAAELLEIRLFDHVILGAPGLQETQPYFSFRENGYL